VETSIAHFGRLDGLFANVADLKAVLVDGDILSNDSALWERTLRVNVTGTALLLKAALPQMLQQGSGALVLTSSDAAVVGDDLPCSHAGPFLPCGGEGGIDDGGRHSGHA
jgi:NAD(P)-dependent dehydrogenase (short-subunit alcohol dehydrogenase family)